MAAELVAHWHRAIQALERMDIKKIKAGSIDLLGDGHIPLSHAAQALGATDAALADRLRLRGAPFLVQADQWLGWAVSDINEAVDYFPDRITGEDEYVIDNKALTRVAGEPAHFSGLLSLRLPEEAADIARSGQGIPTCQFLFWPSRLRGFVVDFPGQLIEPSMLMVRRMDVEALRFDLVSKFTPEMLAAAAAAAPIPHSDPVSESSEKSMTWSKFKDHYLECHEGVWKPDQQRRRKDHLSMFLELCG
ncbi:MAG: integrase, partial [Hylemonella sp.]|nr:integrase [Hylemonella sp.]